MIIRATVGDADVVEALLNDYFRSIGVLDIDEAGTVRAYLASAEVAIWIAKKNDRAAGCIMLRPLVLPGIGRVAECKRLFVRPDCRGLGLASALMDTLESYAKAQGYKWVYLDSKDDLATALAMYQRRDYQPCGRYNDNAQATVFMRKALSV